MNTRCGMKKKKNTTRWLAILIIVALTISSIVLPGSGVSARADNLDDKTVSVENLDEESANKENLTSDTDDKENLNNNITDNNLDSKTTDDKNINTETVDNVNHMTRTVDNENINNNTSDNSNSESNIVNNNQNINTINNENLDSESVNTSNSNKQSAVNSSISTLSEDGIEAYADDEYKTEPAQNFFAAELPSTNGHYIAEGVFVDASGNGTLVIKVDKNDTLKGIENVFINNSTEPIPKTDVKIINTSKFIIDLPGEDKEITDGQCFILINLGDFDKVLNYDETDQTYGFTLTVKTQAGGWDIKGERVKVNIKYSITKAASPTSAKIGDKITYTIKIKNESDITLYNINVVDNIPNGIEIESVSEADAVLDYDNNVLTLEQGVTLHAWEEKTYNVIATVRGENVPSTITNTATIGGSVYEKSATADVTVTKDVIIRKIVAGNMGDTKKEFDFNAIVKKGDIEYKNVSFKLTHEGEPKIIEIPADAILTLSESGANNYDITASINNGKEFTIENGVCTIELGKYDTRAVEISITNTRNVLIDTGVLLDSLPYIAILGVVIIGGGIFFINKRKKGNDI